ncbi:hypothetical protein HK102_006023 [Quaeritorhiza haematococci]|nr:hypothetical protein HK102_006023 [Quaeritorhiza haematococci]
MDNVEDSTQTPLRSIVEEISTEEQFQEKQVEAKECCGSEELVKLNVGEEASCYETTAVSACMRSDFGSVEELRTLQMTQCTPNTEITNTNQESQQHESEEDGDGGMEIQTSNNDFHVSENETEYENPNQPQQPLLQQDSYEKVEEARPEEMMMTVVEEEVEILKDDTLKETSGGFKKAPPKKTKCNILRRFFKWCTATRKNRETTAAAIQEQQ